MLAVTEENMLDLLSWGVMIMGLLFLVGLRIKDSFYMGLKSIKTDFMCILISILVLGSALFIVLSASYGEAHQKWAFGATGTILGYWLKR
jgi:hypothetical protein